VLDDLRGNGAAGSPGSERDLLGPQGHRDRPVGHRHPGRPHPEGRFDPPGPGGAGQLDDLPHERRGRQGGRLVVQLGRRPDLLHPAAQQQHHRVGQRQSFGLVVGDQHRGRAGVAEHPGDLLAHGHPQGRVQRARRRGQLLSGQDLPGGICQVK
jgi:hypothetical protein